jgi:hypothetical protein
MPQGDAAYKNPPRPPFIKGGIEEKSPGPPLEKGGLIYVSVFHEDNKYSPFEKGKSV